MKRFVLFFTTLLVMASILTSCDSTKPNSLSLKGKVTLINDTGDPANDPVDFSGVTVALYELATLDTALVRLNGLHPLIGIQISQETEFDHRLVDPVYSGTTDAEGDYSLGSIRQGTYNLVFSKAGWGAVVRHEVTMESKSGKLFGKSVLSPQDPSAFSEFDTVSLFPETTLPQILSETYVFKPDHTYIVDTDTNILGTSVFEGGSLLLLEQNVNLNFNGLAECDSTAAYSWIKSRNVTVGQTDIPRWNSLKFHASGQSLSKLVACNANTAIAFYGTNSALRHSRISCAVNGVYLGEDYSRVEDCLFNKIDSRAAIYNPSEGSNTIKHWVLRSIFYQCTEAIRTLGQPIDIMDNYFLENTEALISFRGYHRIQHNEFDRNESGVVINGNIYTIDQNRFYSNENSILFSITYHTSISNPRIKDNNFYQTSGWAIKLWPRTITADVNASGNYWKGENVDALVVDVVDIPLVVYHLIYLPKRTSQLTTAGIRG